MARVETYKGVKVYYQRFMYDLISMFGLNLFYLDLNTLELMLRQVYRSITFNFEAGKLQLRRLQDVEPAFTEKEFDEAMEKDNYEDSPTKTVEAKHILANTNSGSGDLGVGTAEGDVDGDMPGEKDLFTNLLGNHEESYQEAKRKKLEEKKALVQETTQKRSQVQPFLWSTSLLKEDPFKVYQVELKKEKRKPVELAPSQPDSKLRITMKKREKAPAAAASVPATTRSRRTQKILLGAGNKTQRGGAQGGSPDLLLQISTQRLIDPQIINEQKAREASLNRQRVIEGQKIIASPTHKKVASKIELELTGNNERIEDLNSYYHLHEFDPVDLMEDLDIEEKYKRKKKQAEILEKFQKLPEDEKIRRF